MIAYAGKRSRVGEIVVFLCLLLLAVSTERMHGRDELYVLNVNPPSVSVIDSESFEKLPIRFLSPDRRVSPCWAPERISSTFCLMAP